MFIWDDIIGGAFKLLEKAIPDPAARDAAKLALLQAEQNGELDEIKTQLSAINTEGASADPWTSRARPAFLYVIYTLILASLPMAVIYAYSPETAKGLIEGFNLWLKAIPQDFIQLFGIGYLGYTGGRSFDKWQNLKYNAPEKPGKK